MTAAHSQDDLLRSILAANATYADAFSRSDPALLSKLAKGQSPRICWLGCSDSRVSAELSTGVAPGSIFVHRNIAQCFHPNDPSALAAITYAVTQLKVDAIIVCGHTGCGGVRAAMMEGITEVEQGSPVVQTSDAGKLISGWVAPIKDLAIEQVKANQSAEHSHPLSDPLSPLSLATLTDRHVAETVRLVSESSVVREAWANGVELSIHGWVYHVATAKLRDLDIGVKGVGVSASLGSTATSYAGSEPPEDSESN
ncbi:carbonate dehydratase [Pseudohyphozyma bogoriensis]|nr:carbonate dehydratase [Pseudohyphozyma bogoriensis]